MPGLPTAAASVLGKRLRRLTLRAAALALLPLVLALATCSPKLAPLTQVHGTGVLRMATVNSATTYYLAAHGPTGLEYDLGRGFAERLDARLEVVVVPNAPAALAAVRSGRAHFAAGLAATPARRRLARFAPPYFQVLPQVVVHTDAPMPESLADLAGELVVPAHSAVATWLRNTHPQLEFTADPNANEEELLYRVASGEIAATVAGSNLVKLNQRYYPQLRVAFALPVQQRLAWAFAPDTGDAVFNKAVAYFAELQDSRRMQVLVDRYYGHADRLGFVGGQTFARIVEKRLDKWREQFKRAGKKTGIDWRLLAAMGYQESHWNPDAVSPTGVRGLMMLTEATAKEVGVEDRTDPQQSIAGGARYIDYLRERLPDSVKPPDRTWLALVAYNIGMGHLLDARRLLKARGMDPNLWVNVRTALPWLTQERYHKETRYGYARGHEAVAYVGNIRAYYDILLWMTGERDARNKPESLKAPSDQPASPVERALRIDSPAL